MPDNSSFDFDRVLFYGLRNFMTSPASQTGLKRRLPPIGSPGYHLMLGAVAIFILGPLGGISAAYMNFSIGMFIGGQVLAGILGSTVTLPYGPEGKHGANYIQTMSASVAGMCGMGVLLQAMVWLGLPEPPIWQLILYFTCIGMFGVGIGMLYTPVVVDRMQLAFPSGFAVANILRALTDPKLLRQSIAQLGGGMLGGYGIGLSAHLFQRVAQTGVSAATFGAGMIVGARIALPSLVVAFIGEAASPYLERIGWLPPGAPFRQIGFIIALGAILGAAIVDLALILFQAARRFREKGSASPPAEDWKRVNMVRLVLWVIGWGAGIIVVGSQVLHQPPLFLAVAVGLCFVFVLINGISIGISDNNPISAAFVVTVFILATVGLKDPGVGLMCASVLLISCSLGGDMQQDRSTGWRLSTNRVNQFRYQVIGIAMGAILAVILAKTFMSAYPVLRDNAFSNPGEASKQWNSAMTYKVVGALDSLTNPQKHTFTALQLGLGIGFLIEIARKLLKSNRRYKEFARKPGSGRTTDFILDAFLLPSPYAAAFGGFVPLLTTVWWSSGGVLSTLFDLYREKTRANRPAPGREEIPADMSPMSLTGGGLIAGEALAALSIGIYMLITTIF